MSEIGILMEKDNLQLQQNKNCHEDGASNLHGAWYETIKMETCS